VKNKGRNAPWEKKLKRGSGLKGRFRRQGITTLTHNFGKKETQKRRDRKKHCQHGGPPVKDCVGNRRAVGTTSTEKSEVGGGGGFKLKKGMTAQREGVFERNLGRDRGTQNGKNEDRKMCREGCYGKRGGGGVTQKDLQTLSKRVQREGETKSITKKRRHR